MIFKICDKKKGVLKDMFLESLRKLMNNYVVVVSVVTWFVAQFLKVLLIFVATGELSLERFFGAGGMPSSHTALVVSAACAMGRKVGVNSPEFGFSLIFAGIVMYDAVGVRRAAGEHAKVINKMLLFTPPEEKIIETNKDPDDNKVLKELLGHTPIEVLCGFLLAIFIVFLFPIF
jgi:acid phosphatase family membrane protein YuiD